MHSLVCRHVLHVLRCYLFWTLSFISCLDVFLVCGCSTSGWFKYQLCQFWSIWKHYNPIPSEHITPIQVIFIRYPILTTAHSSNTHTHVHTHSLWYVSFTLNPLCPLGVSSLYLKRCCWVLCHWKYFKWVCCVSSIPMFNMYEAEKKSLLDCNSFHITFSNIIFAILHL